MNIVNFSLFVSVTLLLFCAFKRLYTFIIKFYPMVKNKTQYSEISFYERNNAPNSST